MDKNNGLVPKKAGRPKGAKNKSVTYKKAIKENLLKALIKTKGIVGPAVKAVGVDRATFMKYYEEDLQFRKMVEDIKEYAIDHVESQLFKQIENGGAAQTIFYLKTRAAQRGYVEHQNMNLTVDQVRIKYIVPQEDDKKLTEGENG